jgi:hypothetical protein
MNHFSNERYRWLAEKLRDVSGWGKKGKNEVMALPSQNVSKALLVK